MFGLFSTLMVSAPATHIYVQVQAFKEFPNPVTGVAQQFCPLNDDGEVTDETFSDPYPASSKLNLKRSIVRRISSTYA